METLAERSIDETDVNPKKLNIDIQKPVPVVAESPGFKVGRLTVDRESVRDTKVQDISPAISEMESVFQMKRLDFPRTPHLSNARIKLKEPQQNTSIVHRRGGP